MSQPLNATSATQQHILDRLFPGRAMYPVDTCAVATQDNGDKALEPCVVAFLYKGSEAQVKGFRSTASSAIDMQISVEAKQTSQTDTGSKVDLRFIFDFQSSAYHLSTSASVPADVSGKQKRICDYLTRVNHVYFAVTDKNDNLVRPVMTLSWDVKPHVMIQRIAAGE